MAAISAYTIDEAREMLELWKSCERALASGQVTSYRVGTRECTLVDMEDIRAAINYFGNRVEALSGSVRTKRVTRVVPRDL
ncbi:MAG: DUF6148 family protein [Clostridiales bacterium]|nr:DUF6148 family protein [Clostridiales bacterium]